MPPPKVVEKPDGLSESDGRRSRLLRDDAWPLPDLATDEVRALPEVDDPAGGDIDDFVDCARRIAADMAQLLPRLDAWAVR